MHRGRGQNSWSAKRGNLLPASQFLPSYKAVTHGTRGPPAAPASGFCCPVIKGQSLNGDEQSCNGKLGGHCVEGRFLLLFWRRCWPPQPLPGSASSRSRSACPRLGAAGARLPFHCSWHDPCQGNGPHVSPLCLSEQQPWCITVRALGSLRCLCRRPPGCPALGSSGAQTGVFTD